ncbi:YgjV family protein [Enterobacteriaceae bacterium ESL0689]|nr:YgjV family protein [Enterobacteriaceae bacterium ESL0689]
MMNLSQYQLIMQELLSLPQIIGYLGYLIGVSTFFQKDDHKFRFQLTLVNITMAIHFYLLGPDAYVAAILNIINIFRNIASMHTRNILVMLFFIILMWCLSLPALSVPIQYLTVIGTTLVTYSLFRLEAQRMRIGILISSLLWIIYSLWAGSIGGLAIEITFAIANIITILKIKKNTVPC